MPETSFDEFVRREQQATTSVNETPIDWLREKNDWLRHVNELFTKVAGFLREYVTAGQVAIDHGQIELNEDNIGPYVAPTMIVKIGRKTITMEPVGTLLIGSKGRVDVVGPLGRVQLLLLDSQVRALSDLIHVSVSIEGRPQSPPASKHGAEIKWAWRIVTKPPRTALLEVNRDNFLSLLTELANG
jgi:hypothetical protein